MNSNLAIIIICLHVTVNHLLPDPDILILSLSLTFAKPKHNDAPDMKRAAQVLCVVLNSIVLPTQVDVSAA